MIELIDFTDCPETNKAYGGGNGRKVSIRFNDDLYLLKFPKRFRNRDDLSYDRSVLSEYIGSQVLNLIGLPAQETVLGTFKLPDKVKLCVACRDFTGNGYVVQDFAAEMNKMLSSLKPGGRNDLDAILEVIRSQRFMDPLELETFFWRMFVGDALIGNAGRDSRDWGFLYNQETDTIRTAPLWGQSSSLYPQIDESEMRTMMQDQEEFLSRICEFPNSAIKRNGRKISYFTILSSDTYPLCTAALQKVVSHIDLNRINQMIDDIPVLSDLRKEFYKYVLKARKELILDRALHVIKARQTELAAEERNNLTMAAE